MTGPEASGRAGGFVLGVAEERQSGFSQELSLAAEAAAQELGWRHRRVNSAADEAVADTVLAIGNVRLFPDMLRRDRAAARVLWHGETLPRETEESGGRLHRLAPTGRLLDGLFTVAPVARRVAALQRWREQAAIVREPQENLRLLKGSAARFDRIVIDSHDRAVGAIAAGLAVDVVPYGYHASYAGELHSRWERPVAVMLLAHLVGRHGRRQRLAAALERELTQRGIVLARLVGGAYGQTRTAALRQVRVVVDIHRVPGNYPGFRWIVASAAGAALVSEPLANPEPLIAGVHYVESTATNMPDAVAGLLADEQARRRLVEASQALLATELHLTTVLPRVVQAGRA